VGSNPTVSAISSQNASFCGDFFFFKPKKKKMNYFLKRKNNSPSRNREGLPYRKGETHEVARVSEIKRDPYLL